MTTDQLTRYRRYRREGETALMAYRRVYGVPGLHELEECNWPTRNPGVFCVSLMTYRTMLTVRPQRYFSGNR